ncbi:S53 family peptidase [Thalassospira marina]|uniref:Peptidase S53 n=1 Tax=Thalassospira marina TaxID=2048283 RepID=A0A2N3KQW3_9PROT|nr:S53 family peptidase [Thalassospira marina]PKR52931.1 peptidase S53 [Thalassospira marina]
MTSIRLSGTAHPVFQQSPKALARAGDERVKFNIHLTPGNTKNITDAKLANLKHKGRRKTRATLQQNLHPSLDAIQRVTQWAATAGLQPINNAGIPGILSFEASVAAINAAFGITLATVVVNGVACFGHGEDIHIPKELSDIIDFVSGLDTIPLAAPHLRHQPNHDQISEIATAMTQTAQNGTQTAQGDYPTSYDATTIAEMYDFPPKLDGTGQRIAIVELGGGYTQADIDAYFAKYNLKTPAITAIGVAGAENNPGQNSNNDSEVVLDIQIAGAVAPGAEFFVYFVPNYSYSFALALQTILGDKTNNPDIISISWGGSEETYPAKAREMTQKYCKLAAAHYVTVLSSSGDHGANNGGSAPTTNFPACIPEILGCGGTQIETKNNRIISEVVWDNLAFSWGGASGGGISSSFAVPTYQQNLPLPQSPNGKPGRGVPDVSANADPLTGYKYYRNGKWSFVGGTSAVVPLWAGLVARLNQGLGEPVGNINSELYKCAATGVGFSNIIEGNNGYYHAGPGWNACTGLGSPEGEKLYAYFHTQAGNA